MTGFSGNIAGIGGGIGSQEYYGGSLSRQQNLEARNSAQIASGQTATQDAMRLAGPGSNGFNYIDQGGANAQAAQLQAQRMSMQGMGMGASAYQQQSNLLNQMQAAANRNNGMAAAQYQMGMDQTRQAMMTQAAGARGGNAAAAMRSAQAQGSAMSLQGNQQAAMIRAQENQMRMQNLGAIAQARAGQSALGYGMAGQGIGMQGQLAGTQGQLGGQYIQGGLGVGGLGLQQQQTYLDQERAMYGSQLQADTDYNNRRMAYNGAIVGAFGSGVAAVGSMGGGMGG